jgi:hypothetical protein
MIFDRRIALMIILLAPWHVASEQKELRALVDRTHTVSISRFT